MRLLLVAILVMIGGYFFYGKNKAGEPEIIADPVYAEMRTAAHIQGRDIEMAVFAKTGSDDECQYRTQKVWRNLLAGCPSCDVMPPKCQAELRPRYAKLFRDEPISSAYLSVTPGQAGEREGRLVIYGLTDAEGKAICEQMKQVVLKSYKGTAHCVEAVG